VKLSGKHVYAQCIDDESGVTLAFLSTLAKEIAVRKLSSNVVGATLLGKAFGEKAAAAGVRSVVFDRGDRKYHGCVKAFADAAREAGLLF
jgi:large subunit ribosomal protein L18